MGGKPVYGLPEAHFKRIRLGRASSPPRLAKISEVAAVGRLAGRPADGLHQRCIGPCSSFFCNFRVAPLWPSGRSHVAVLWPCCSASIPQN